MNHIDTILNGIQLTIVNTLNNADNEEEILFWQNLSKSEIRYLTDIILQKQGTSLTELDKYSMIELGYISKLFPLENINKKIKASIDDSCKYNVCSMTSYRIYTTNLVLIKNFKNYINNRKKLEKEKNGKH